MQISSRFTMAIHMFACIDTFTDRKMTSDFMAASIGTAVRTWLFRRDR